MALPLPGASKQAFGQHGALALLLDPSDRRRMPRPMLRDLASFVASWWQRAAHGLAAGHRARTVRHESPSTASARLRSGGGPPPTANRHFHIQAEEAQWTAPRNAAEH